MCRQYCFVANEETKIECTLVHAQNALMLQSRKDMRGTMHPDGWGISVYEDFRPVVERRVAAAYEDLHFSAAAERVFSSTVIAHVRKATVGRPSLVNTHPFTHQCWTFAHNGTVTAIDVLRDRLLAEIHPHLRKGIRGDTDSELLFHWILSRMEDAGISAEARCADLPVLSDVVAESIQKIAADCETSGVGRRAKLNILLTDGRIAVATRWNNSLWWLFREGIHDCEVCGIAHVRHAPEVEYLATIVASEPVSHEAWQEVPDRTLVAIDRSIRPRLYPIE
jgi:glutamine amidotransferase